MKPERPRSILADSGGGWFDSGSVPLAGVFGEPECSLSFSGGETRLLSRSGEEISEEDPLSLVERISAGGRTAVGYVSYDYLRHTVPGARVCGEKEDGPALPLVFFHFYRKEDFRVVTVRQVLSAVSPRSGPPFPPPLPNVGRAEYAEKISEIKERIAAGDVYQVNLSRKFRFAPLGDSLSWFLDFYRAQPVPFAALLGFPGFDVASGSMELFLRKRGRRIVTRPVKGTMRRDPDPARDRELAETLRKSPKERAENLMIVDLMRNDLGRICEYGSVAAGKLFSVAAYSTLFQMESEVSGRLRPGVGLSETVAGTFPPGSVTGAPKREALRIIDGLEPHLRGPYCGAVCLFHPNGDFTMSVAIRTGVSRPEGADFWFGGGIVWDSDAQAEFRETELKAKAVTSVVSREVV